MRPTHSYPQLVLAIILFTLLTAPPNAPMACGQINRQPASAYRWTAEGFTAAANNPPIQVSIDGVAAVRFEASKKSHIDLTDQFAWNTLTGQCTLRTVFHSTRYPSGKMPLLSKWHMTDGGRAFELGILSDGRPFFDVSPSGNWDPAGGEVVGTCSCLPGHTYCLAAVFEPGRSMSLYVNGKLCGSLSEQVPQRIFENDTPVWLGAQPPGARWADTAVAEIRVDTRVLSAAELSTWAQKLGLTELPTLVKAPVTNGRMNLSAVREQVLDYCGQLQVEHKPFGTLRTRTLPAAPVTLYASCDVAWTRACMGEDLMKTLSASQRQQWIDHINSFARPDGTYENPNHGEMHRNGMVIGALAVLGGRQKYPVSLYDQFDELDEIQPWLEKIEWERQWGASHLFWGGMHCFSVSGNCNPEWRNKVFNWLDANADPKTGWWRKGVPQAGRHIEVLGGAAHIWPVYQYHKRPFPYPKQIIDSILAMQKEDGSWLGMSNYMELDALYGLAYMHSLVPDYRAADITAAAHRHGQLVQSQYASFLSSAPPAHTLLSVVSTLALLQQLDAEHFHDDVRWSDIFSDGKFYATDRVECLANPRQN